MDDFERRVLRHRKPTFAESVDITADLLTNVKRANLVNEDMVQVIQSEKHMEPRASIFVDYLSSSQLPSAFDIFISILMTDYSWLAKELQAGVKAERGNLEIDDDVMKEAGMLVHRKFGTSRRISELDKKDMQEMIAVKIQISKEEWKEELDILKKEIKRLECFIDGENEKAKETDRAVHKFIKANQSKLISRAHGMKTTSDILRTTADDGDVLSIMKARLELMMSRTKVVMEERDLLFDEREKCLLALDVKDDAMPLHDILKQRAAQLPSQMHRLEEELDEKEKAMRRLRKLLKEYETELDENESKVKGIRDDLADLTTENLDMKRYITELERDLGEQRARAEAKSSSSSTSSKKSRRTTSSKSEK